MKAADLRNQTPYVTADEKAMGLVEVELLTPDNKGVHRYQIIYVVRNDQQSPYVTDLGDRLLYPNPPLNILSYMEHSVAELQEMATEARERSSVTKRLAELTEASRTDKHIIKEFLEQKERNWKVIRNQSHYGPTVTVQRTGF
jgi:hypothetical protein